MRGSPGEAQEAETTAEVGRERGQLQRAWVLGGSPHLILWAAGAPGAEQGTAGSGSVVLGRGCGLHLGSRGMELGPWVSGWVLFRGGGGFWPHFLGAYSIL